MEQVFQQYCLEKLNQGFPTQFYLLFFEHDQSVVMIDLNIAIFGMMRYIRKGASLAPLHLGVYFTQSEYVILNGAIA
ncbi:hypothetical protein [Coleofasciculus sp. E1-EBD-02]|uniref:hypothetical protein n=1 Tax=Coleofasciculus sp. E1-EBD-02 TaxID=3068481 RepID=UPI0032FA08F6